MTPKLSLFKRNDNNDNDGVELCNDDGGVAFTTSPSSMVLSSHNDNEAVTPTTTDNLKSPVGKIRMENYLRTRN